jgi:epoxyqueuosine reductase QueG
MHLARKIEKKIKLLVEEANTVTKYREPLVGFASAHDSLFTQIKEIIGKHHAHPKELLPEAKTVISFFIPFAQDVVISNRIDDEVSREWAVAYIETNALIEYICEELMKELSLYGIKSFNEKATHNFNEVDLTASWSHRSAAYIAGLGTFGVNHMLITSSGCAGRFGSIIISAEISPTPRPKTNFCKYFREEKCLACVKNCPTGALQAQSFDKFKCYEHLLKIDKRFTDLGLADVCGKCTVGPCAFSSF